jgi:beta-N-acetylhexosaminidase
MKHLFSFLIFLPLFLSSLKAQSLEDTWVNDTYNTLNDTQRIGQLIMIRAHSNLGADHVAEVENLIQKYHVGSLCFFQGTLEKQAQLTNRYQSLSKIPLFIAMDAEWGLNMRLKDATIAYPKQMMLGAIQDNTLIYKLGAAIAKECKRLGVHINFAPDVDVNNNPNNPVINERSFGENKYNVATKGFMYMLGMQDNGVMACAKHFPGHGDTDVDSHKDLPLISHDIARLNALELLPFRVLAQNGIGSIMVAHLQVPAIDNTPNMPASLSKNAVFNIIRKDIGYDGLIFTDALEMKGVTKYYGRGEVSARAIAAGNDVLCLPESTPEAFDAIKRFISEGKIDTLELEKSVKRVLKAKYKFGLTTPLYIDPNYIRQDINSYESKMLKRGLIKNALTLVRNTDKILPFKTYQPDSMASLSLGSNRLTVFQTTLNNYGIFNHVNTPKNFTETRKQELLRFLSKKQIVLVSLHDMKLKASQDFGLTTDEKTFLQDLNKVTKVVLVVFGNPYSLKYFDDIPNLVCAYDEDNETQELAAQALFGSFDFKGKLPVTASEKAKGGMGFNTFKINQLEWNNAPEVLGFNPKMLEKIDDIANELINNGAAPGCQILVAKDGQVVYHKAFGYHTYDKIQAVTTEDLYDLASVTKCAATTLSLMKLYEEGKVDMGEKMSKYLPILRGSNKEFVMLKEILVHQAGLIPWIPFYKNTLDSFMEKGKKVFFPSPKWYATSFSADNKLEVAKNFYLKTTYLDSIKRQIVDSPLRPNKHYVYSDLGMILMTDVIRTVSGKTLDQYAQDNFYSPLSMIHTLFNPLTKFDETNIAPTEEDHYFRMQRLRGHVHDMAAAMMGGVSGHAGLFSNARDLAILMQMLLNKGEYGGIRYLKPETIALFTTRQEGSTRRGYGWELKELDARKKLNMSASAPTSTYGHTGFTGNAVYNDPENNIIYIFLSNRTYPDMTNNKLINGDYRPRIQSVIYEALKK